MGNRNLVDIPDNKTLYFLVVPGTDISNTHFFQWLQLSLTLLLCYLEGSRQLMSQGKHWGRLVVRRDRKSALPAHVCERQWLK